jgi:pyridoxamine 5'-phosphate oxidase
MEDLRSYINTLRFDFNKSVLDESILEKNPLDQFKKWFIEAVEANEPTPNAMVLCTISLLNKPSARIMLLRNFNENGFVFYTNYFSRKGQDIKENTNVALLFYWPLLERQVRIEGVIEKQGEEDSDIYFNARPDGSKLGAWTSQQSHAIENRKELDKKYEEMKTYFTGGSIPRPPFWGGYIIKPTYYEFWQGRPSRLHDRLTYTKVNDQAWKINRLAP